jgi:hypothetical protein
MGVKNLLNIVITVEEFFKSQRETMDLNIELMDPVNKTLVLNISKLSSFQETLNNVVARIKLFIHNLILVESIYNGIPKISVFSDIKSSKSHIDLLEIEAFKQYLSKHSKLSGKLNIQ